MTQEEHVYYIGDYRADTTHLSAAQHGGYLLLIMHYWSQGGLPEDDEQLARIACMTLSEWRKHRAVIRAFFGEGWRHKRVEHELQTANDRYERRSKAGQKGNSARWSHRNATPMGSQPQPPCDAPNGEHDVAGRRSLCNCRWAEPAPH